MIPPRTRADKERQEVERQARLKGAERRRTAALTAALAKLGGEATVIKGEGSQPNEHMPDALTAAERSAQLTAQNMPLTERINTEKPGFRNGIQYRPQTVRERENEMNERLDKQALSNWNNYCELVQQDIDLGEAQERQRQQRESRERRTGMRPLPNSDDHCSLVEAARRGLINRGGD